MNGKENKSKRTLDSIKLAGKTSEGNGKLQCLSLLYALSDKFGDVISKITFLYGSNLFVFSPIIFTAR
ncbi:hypothetical protein KQI89_00005 [Clostridium sp. MSJ-4]|uniref:Uncharacterized protein n=2 Tax=Clostridium simiarum TaxID=2841506 RepID=A0ABS6EWW1_9CLOT|nr:hypothetical protein [Clostridium simiarum]